MSLEQALAANTAALVALNATLSNNPQLVAAPSTAAVAPVPTAPVASTDTSPVPTTAFAPSVPTPPSAAAPAAPPTAAPAASGERDSKGMPWDGRIHSATKAKVADGSWRYKRGSDDAVVAQVEAELRAAQAAPVPAPTGGPAFAPHPFYDTPAAPVAAPAPVAPVAVPVPPAATVAPAAVPAATVAPAAVPAATVATYDALMAALPPKIVSGELTATQMQQACEQYGVPSIAALASRPDLVPFIAAALRL